MRVPSPSAGRAPCVPPAPQSPVGLDSPSQTCCVSSPAASGQPKAPQTTGAPHVLIVPSPLPVPELVPSSCAPGCGVHCGSGHRLCPGSDDFPSGAGAPDKVVSKRGAVVPSAELREATDLPLHHGTQVFCLLEAAPVPLSSGAYVLGVAIHPRRISF